MTRRVMKCQMNRCQNPATWKHGTWYACDDCIGPVLGPQWFNFAVINTMPSDEEMFESGKGYTPWGTAYRANDYFDPWPNMSEEWAERVTVEIKDET